MNEDTIALLQECNAGCKMGTNSIEQMLPEVKNEKLKEIMEAYDEKNRKIGEDCHELLNEAGHDEKDPSKMAKAFSWFTTEVKLMVNDDMHQITDMLIDGCNMAVKSLAENLNDYKEADTTSINLVRKLIKIEQDFSKELLEFV